ncbi:uncharacterized protein [Leptinotarsa decemlineata]|uniref:uncharacterized protein n=1 Tax=Leptinotarsa decemlineata TaxID=7539 RepID=UPI003D30A056
MEQLLTNDSAKKTNLEDLSKEDLVRKCTNLLAIAQKAKQAKTILQEENSRLKELADSKITASQAATQELIENLTQQKLSFITNIDDLKAQNESLSKKLKLTESELETYREKLGSCDNENISYRRQITRLTYENDQLLNDLDTLEKQIEKLKEIGVQQQEQLLEVDKANSLEHNEITTSDLQRMLSISLEEVRKLKSDNNTLENKVENLQMNLLEKDKSIIVISEELNTKNKNITDLTKELKLENELKESIKKLEKDNMELREKVKIYHSKIVKFATTAKQLREDKNSVLDVFKAYTDQVKNWKDQLKRAEITLLKYISSMEFECQHLKQQIDDHKHNENELKNKLIQISSQENDVKIIQEQWESEKLLLLEKLKDSEIKISKLSENIETLQEENNNLRLSEQNSKELSDETNNRILEENIRLENKLKQVLTNQENELKILNDQSENEKKILENRIEETEQHYKKILESLEEEKQTLKEKQMEYENKTEEMSKENILLKNELEASITKLLENIETLQEENKNLRLAEQNSKEHSDETNNKILEENIRLENELKQVLTNHENEFKILKDQSENEKNLLENRINKNEQDYKKILESLKEEKQILKQKEMEYENEIEEVKEEKMLLQSKLEETQSKLSEMEQLQQKADVLANKYQNNLENLQVEKEKLKEELQNEIKIIQKENSSLRKVKDDLMAELDLSNNEKKSLKKELKERNNESDKKLEENSKKIQQSEILISDLQNQIISLEELGKRSGEEIKNLAEENKQLSFINETIQEKLNQVDRSRLNVTHSSSQTDEMSTSTTDLEEQITDLKRENTELLSEMNEMNQAIKERGENISILQAHCEEVLKKLQIYEVQANKNVDSIAEKERVIEDLTREIEDLRSNNGSDLSAKEEINELKSEIETLKEKLNANLEASYIENDTMSTSTISKTEEISRLKDLEGSWEERYGKLRNLAVKLKGKIRELTQTVNKQQEENEDLQKKLSINIKTIQNLQSEMDKLQDELENSRKESKQFLNRLNSVANDISKDKQALAEKEEIISALKQEVESYKNEKQDTEKWKKQVSAKVHTLRKELEANNLMKKDFETRISKLTSELEAQEQLLKTEIESHKHTKTLLDQSNNECKKNSVLSLEMQDYERSVKETAKKLEKQLEEISNLKGQVESQKTTITALREQNKLLEERLADEEQNITTISTEITAYKKKISALEDEVSQKLDKIQNLTQLLETNRSETEELSTELSKVIAEHQKTNNTLKIERDHLRSQILGLQQSLREAQDGLKLKTDELALIQNEYDGYKVRAQSVLRQNQSRDIGLEEKMSEEVASLTAENSSLKSHLEQNRQEIEKLEQDNKNLVAESEINAKRLKEVEGDLDELKSQYAALSAKHEKTLSENAETVRSLKVHADTLSQCYRQQISEQEVRHNREIIELQSRLEKAPSPTESPPVLPTMTREEGEGSESIESNLAPTVHPIPLERLLGSDSEHEIDRMRKKLGEEESKVVHLTALLSDTEQDLVKHVQMNKLLKEEIRRQQRSEEREKHAENLEYLKNVVFKFVTLNSGDERTRLVPVLNTILKLSPEEARQLTMVAKGEASLKGWTNYLPVWSSSNKPQ